MNLAILMDSNSPWSTHAALKLAECGAKVHVITIGKPDKAHWGGYSDEGTSQIDNVATSFHLLEPPLNNKLSYLALLPKLKKVLRSCETDVLLSLAGGWYGTMAYLSRFQPYAIYIVGGDILSPRGVQRPMTNWMLRSAALTAVNGEYLADQTRAFCPSANVMPLYLGIDTGTFTPAPSRDDAVRIICTRRFESLYNNDYLIDGLAGLPDSETNVITTFVSYGELLSEAKSYASQQLTPRRLEQTHFLGGVEKETLVQELRQADIYVSLSRTDGTSISLLEAMACGLFPILSDIPQNREWIDLDAQNGLLLPLDKPDALAQAIERAVTDKELRNRAAKFNRQLVIDKASSLSSMKILFDELNKSIKTG